MRIAMLGLGKIGMPVAAHMMAAGHDVIGYRRSSMDEFTAAGGMAAASIADAVKDAEMVLSCLPGPDALRSVMDGLDGLVANVAEGVTVIELGSHPVEIKQCYVAPLAERNVTYIDGEVSGTPGMVSARKAMVFLACDAEDYEAAASVVGGFTDQCMHLGAFGSATKAKLVNNVLVALDIAGAAQAMALALKMGLDEKLLIEALAAGSGSSVQFRIRAPWMAERKFTPVQGSPVALKYYLDEAGKTAREHGVGTDLIDALSTIYEAAIPTVGERDVAALIDHFDPDLNGDT